MLVDSHTHIFESGCGGPFGLPASATDLVRDMDANEVDVSVVLPLPGVASNQYVQEQCAKFPNRLVGLYTPEFDHPSTMVDDMERFFQRYTFGGLKIHPRWQRVTINDPKVREALEWAAERSLTVLFDLFPFGDNLDEPALQPLAYHRLAQEMPALKMILAHAGGYRVMETFLVAKSNSNVYLDISFTPVYFKGSSVFNDLAFVCRRIPPGRILYGSDFPHVRSADSLQAARALAIELEDSATEALFAGAACDLFKITRV